MAFKTAVCLAIPLPRIGVVHRRRHRSMSKRVFHKTKITPRLLSRLADMVNFKRHRSRRTSRRRHNVFPPVADHTYTNCRNAQILFMLVRTILESRKLSTQPKSSVLGPNRASGGPSGEPKGLPHSSRSFRASSNSANLSESHHHRQRDSGSVRRLEVSSFPGPCPSRSSELSKVIKVHIDDPRICTP